jgi:hypothetical protein
MKFTKSIFFSILLLFCIIAFSPEKTNSLPNYRLHTTPSVTLSKPGPKYVWVKGHWIINKHGKKVWVPGHWKKI